MAKSNARESWHHANRRTLYCHNRMVELVAHKGRNKTLRGPTGAGERCQEGVNECVGRQVRVGVGDAFHPDHRTRLYYTGTDAILPYVALRIFAGMSSACRLSRRSQRS